MPHQSYEVLKPEFLKIARAAKKLSLREAADRLPCGKSALQALETGKLKTLSKTLGDRIVEVYGAPIEFLFVPAPSVKRGRPAKDRGQVAA